MFKLLRFFTITSLVTFIIVTILLVLLYRQVAVNELIEIETQKSVALTQIFANSLWPQFAPFINSASGLTAEELKNHPRMIALHQAVLQQTQGLSVVKVKVYDMQGLTVFSTEMDQIGEDKEDNAGFLAARSGGVESIITYRDTFNAFDKVVEDRNVLSSYVPIQPGGENGSIEGVFEVYSDVTPLLHEIERVQQNLIIGITLILGGLYFVLFFVVRYADHTIQRQARVQQAVEAALQETVQQQAAVAELGQQALQGTTLTALMDNIMQLIAKTLKVDHVKILELMPTTNTLFLRAGLGWQEGDVGQFTMPVDRLENEAGYTLGAANIVVVENFAEETRFKRSALLEEQQIVSSINVLIRGQHQLFGILGIDTTQQRIFSTDDLNFLQATANILALTIEHRQAELEVRHRHRELLTLQSAGVAITSSLNLQETLETVAAEMCSWLGSAGCAVSEWNPTDDTLVLLVDYGPEAWEDKGQAGDITHLADFPRTKQVLLERQHCYVSSDQTEADPAELAYLQEIDVESLLMLPMTFQDRVIGLVEIVDDWRVRTFIEEEITLGQLLANQAASAIENARLYQQAQQELAERKEAEKALQAYKADLEAQVASRTRDITFTNAQLRQEIDERRQAEAALQRAKEAADMANRAKTNFLANMSHELRTPLNGILGYAQILQRDKRLTLEQQRAVGTIHQSGTHLLTLLNDILDLSKIESGRFELHREEFHLGNFLKEIVAVLTIRAQEKEIRFIFEPSPNLPLAVVGDEKRLRQVLINLLGNAVKFTTHGQVVFQVQDRGHHFRFRVADTGPGIFADDLNTIFSPFYQGDVALNKSEGTGLGLSISQHLVEMMGSALQVESIQGEGSTFWFDLTLPIAQGWVETVVPSAQPIIGFAGSPRRILIVDDAPEGRFILHEMLTPLGFDLAQAEDGAQALQKTQEFLPDVILMDVVMPVMDGLAATRQLREIFSQERQGYEPVIIAISASAFEDDALRSVLAGCDDFIAKPIYLDRLLQVIQIHLELEWFYEPITTTLNDTRVKIDLPPEEVASLLLCARKGDIKGIRNHLNRLEALDENYQPFIMEIRRLADRYRIKQIRELLNAETNYNPEK